MIVEEELKPEKSYNVNLNYLKKIYTSGGTFIGIETSAWYTYFTNSIIPDYDTDPNQIIYKNLMVLQRQPESVPIWMLCFKTD